MTKQAKPLPYTVEPTNDSCEKCGRCQYEVIGPDGIGQGTEYCRREDAEDEANALNQAYALGAQSTGKVREAVAVVAASNGITWDAETRTLHDDGDVDFEAAASMTLVELLESSEADHA